MIAGVLLYNSNSQETLFRSPLTLDDITTQNIITAFINEPKKMYGTFTNSLNYIYKIKNNFYICIITTYPSYLLQDLMNLYYTSFNEDFFRNISIIDDTINQYTCFVLSNEKINEYLKMESQEEKLHEMVKKTKELEMKKKMKEYKKNVPTSQFDIHLEKVKELEKEIRKPLEKEVQKKEIKEIFRENKTKLEMNSEVQIILKEKLKVSVNKENEIKSCEVEGDLCVLIQKEDYKNLSIKINSSLELKFSPNLDKLSLKDQILCSNKGFPINKNIALAKWKRNKLENLPINFTFWPSDLEDGRYQILFEISCEEDLSDLMFCFNTENLKDVFIESGKAVIKEYLEWQIGNISKGDVSTLEFTCSCSSPSDIFPINLYFTGKFFKSPLVIEDVSFEYEKQEVCEVESYVIVDE